MNSSVKQLTGDERIKRHEKLVSNLLQDRDSRGYYAMYSIIHPRIQIPIKQIRDTFLNIGRTYTESLTYADAPITHPDGYSRIYKCRDEKRNLVNSQITTCYFDGLIVTDGYIDLFCEGNDGLNPNWLFYRIQRHLQLSGEILAGLTDDFGFILSFQHLEKFKWEIFRSHRVDARLPYSGYYHDIIHYINMSDIHGRDKWNIKMDIVEKIMIDVARIFGMDTLPQEYWNDKGELDYSHGIPGR